MLKKDHIVSQLFLYGLAGGTAAVIDIGSFYSFVNFLHVDYRLAIFFAFTLGTLTNFSLCNAFIFERRDLSLKKACARHYLSSLGGLATNEIVVISLVELAHFEDLLLAKVIATVIAFIVNFSLIRLYAFNSNASITKRIGRKKSTAPSQVGADHKHAK
jgi:putative flippase GtrA